MEKVFTIKEPIILLTPEQSKIKRLWLKAKAHLSSIPLYDKETLQPDNLFDDWYKREFWSLNYFYFSIPPTDMVYEMLGLYYDKRSSVSVLPLHNSQYDYCIRVLKKSEKGEVSSVTLLIKLTDNEMTLSFYKPRNSN